MADRIEDEIRDNDGNLVDPDKIVWASANITGTIVIE